MDFVANFMENTTVKKFRKSVNTCQTFEQMYSGTVFIETRCRYDITNHGEDGTEKAEQRNNDKKARSLHSPITYASATVVLRFSYDANNAEPTM